jgi:hypothetical protein
MNLQRHHATNVVAVEAAVGEESGEAFFSMDDTWARCRISSRATSRGRSSE